VKRYRILAECVLRTNLDRTGCAPWGVCGGMPGATGRVTVIRNSKSIAADKTDELKLHPGDFVVVETGGGGGYGAPTERPLEEVLADLRSGLVSRQSAERDYGVDFLPDGSSLRR
jgi:N-methylhydantoinase B